MRKQIVVVVLVMVFFLGGSIVQGSIIGSLSTPDTSGLIAGLNGWGPNEDGYRVTWTITLEAEPLYPLLPWHYKYEFSKANGDPLVKLTSHFIISLSEDIQESDLDYFSDDIETVTFGTLGPGPGNPGFPAGEEIYGAKFDLWNNQAVAEFYSNRQPMWGDFYAKDGKAAPNVFNYAYNTDLGVEVANPHDYLGTPIDEFDNVLHKVLVPNTIIPEPATIGLLGLGGVVLLRKRKK